MKPSKSFLIKTIKHQISIIKENLAKGLKSLKSYILDLIDLEEKLDNLTREPVYIFAADCGEFTRNNTINGGEQLVLPLNYIHGKTENLGIENQMIAKLKSIDFSGKLWIKGNYKRLYITCWNDKKYCRSDKGNKVGYIDLVTNKYHGEGKKRLCDMVREVLTPLGVV